MTVGSPTGRRSSASVTPRSGLLPLVKRPLRDGRRFVLRLVVPIIVLVVWQGAITLGDLPSSRVPAPAEVVEAWFTWIFGPQSPLSWSSGTWGPYVLLSLRRVAVGFAIAAAVGITVGVLIGWYSLVAEIFDTWINFLRAVPMTAWVPFAVFFFGIHEPAAISLISLGAFFPIAINTATGTRQTPRILVRAALMLGIHPHRLLWRIVLPSAVPSILTGLRLGVGLAWVLVIVAEMLAVQGGLGYALWTAYQYARLDIIIASILTVGLLGLASDQLLLAIGARALRWQRGLVTSQG
jgi:NitT/TauT family transport system permease protein